MSTFDPMAAALDWLDAYRAASLTIVSMYSGNASNASLECGCDGQQVLTGHTTIAEYWRHCFIKTPAGELVDLRPDGDEIVVSYRVEDGIVTAHLTFDEKGKIVRSRCGPSGPRTKAVDAKKLI